MPNFSYLLLAPTVMLMNVFGSGDAAGSPNQLRVKIPAGRVSARNSEVTNRMYIATGKEWAMLVAAQAGVNYIIIRGIDYVQESTRPIPTGTTHVRFQLWLDLQP